MAAKASANEPLTPFFIVVNYKQTKKSAERSLNCFADPNLVTTFTSSK